jgi:citrate synthase
VGQCNIDHSHEDVIQKLESQQVFIPEHVGEALQRFLKNQHSQQTLNELFHLLKKYDLASKEEQEERNHQFMQLIS